MRIISLFICLLILGCSSQEVAQNHVDTYQIDKKLLGEIQLKRRVSRSPAAIEKEGPQLSAKRVYFKTLYEQYLAFTKISGVTRSINHCPAFHLDFLETKGQQDVISLKKAQHKVSVIEDELMELCDKGVTASSYRFENLVTYHVKKSSFHQDPGSIFSLLKIPVFQNMFELKLIHGVALNHKELLDLTSTFWFSSYLDHHRINKTALSFKDGVK